MAKIAILGSSGVVGRNLIPRLIARGHTLNLINRALPADSPPLQQVEYFIGDIFDTQSLLPGLKHCDLVINLATAIPKPGQSWELNDRIRRTGTQNLIEACLNEGITHVIQQSIAMLYKKHGDAWIDETDIFTPNAITQSAADMENLLAASGLDYVILRGGLLYGPQTGREEGWRKQAQAGTLLLPKNKNDFVSLIHINDLSQAFVFAIESNLTKIALNIVDDEPVCYEALYNYIAEQENKLPLLHSEAEALFAFRIRNQLAKAKLGWGPAFSNYHHGLSSKL